ncbi:DUF1553 domain-containing protein, partial [Akkermansiaceae bacterium]|nr:DUF1553 domain-containing protein [Akkermansiaceae bacterium]
MTMLRSGKSLLVLLALIYPAKGELRFNRDIRPILADTCFNCHGADEGSRKAKLRLDTADGAYADHDGFRAIVPGDLKESELIYRIFNDDEDEVMPPPDHPHQLSETQKNTLKQWVLEGGKYEGHWAFVPPEKAKIQGTSKWGENAIDSFIFKKLNESGLSPQPEASRETLLRRLSLDITGLPPTPEEQKAFLNDKSPDAYEKLVDRLLASPHYGERMAMWWLDGARYADTHGFQADWERYQWPWRDWVIKAFNANMPFDQFTIEQLAGDMLPNATNSQIVATGFNRNHRINTEGGSLAAEWHVENVIDRVETTGSVWMGLTFNCCRCHDHKYDPISQKEFYQFYSFFNNVPEKGVERGTPANFEPTIKVESTEKDAQLVALKTQLSEAEKSLTSAREKEIIRLNSAILGQLKNPWTTQKLAEVTSKGKTTFKEQADGSYLATGPKPVTDQRSIILKPSLKSIHAFQIEALPDPSFANQSYARASNGNFVLTGVTAHIIQNGKKDLPLKIAKARASYEQKGYPIAKSLDGKANTGWAVDGNTKRDPLQAVFDLAKPTSLKLGQQLKITLNFGAFTHHTIDRFRLSVTEVKSPALSPASLDEATILAIKTPHQNRSPKQLKLLTAYLTQNPTPALNNELDQVNKLNSEIKKLAGNAPSVMVMKELPSPRKAFILDRGEYDHPKEEVTAGLPAVLPPLPEGEQMNRLGLARWLVDKKHPLTARVQVNRIWENLFGTGLVESSENFGTQADYPSHPQLLDWLAVDFVENKWDLKTLVKTIVMSSTYRQSSDLDSIRREKDPQNRLLSRGPRFRLQAEMIRDQALAVSGLFNDKIGGPGVRPYQPDGIWSEFNFYGNLRDYKHDTNGNQYRRSLYTIWKRTAAPPGMTLFDMTSREVCTVKRAKTNTPLQALALMNDVTYVEASKALAQQMMSSGNDPESWIRDGFKRATSREITKSELTVLLNGYQRRLQKFSDEPE